MLQIELKFKLYLKFKSNRIESKRSEKPEEVRTKFIGFDASIVLQFVVFSHLARQNQTVASGSKKRVTNNCGHDGDKSLGHTCD